MVRLRIDQNVIAAGEVQREQAVRLRNLQPKCLATKFFRLLDVIDRKTAECFAIFLPFIALFTYYFVFREGFGS